MKPMWMGLLAFGLCACEAPGDAAGRTATQAEFGVFYGGQVQERDEIPLSLDPSEQRQGFRITESPAPAEPLEVRWELGGPGRGRRVVDAQGRKALPRQVRRGSAHFRPGEAVFERVLPFAADDTVGLWNIRVLVADRVVIDRPFVVFDASERARQQEAFDAGW